MTQDIEIESGYSAGATGLIVAVPEAERIVARWRSRLDSSAAAGIPAHITVLFPFLDRHLIDDDVMADLTAIVAAHRSFEVELRECRRFPSVLYLAPAPDSGLRALTEAVFRRWPEAPPYGGQFADIVPHLTVADCEEPQVLDRVEASVSPLLPITVRVNSVQLLVYTGDHWQQAHSFPLEAG